MIRLGIMGHGNLGRGVEAAVKHNPDMQLVAIFTRRDVESVKPLTPGVKVYKAEDAAKHADEIDVLILCGGSATDLPVQTPEYIKYFNVVDSFDTHANIPVHFDNVDKAGKKSGKLGLISCGWDPGMFSLARVYGEAILPGASTYTFWGKGVSQGHSDAIRRIEGVADARQYTVPVPSALEAVRSGSTPVLSTREKHTRECYVVAKEGADKAKIEKEIKEMPNYFADYETIVHFVSEEEVSKMQQKLSHGGFVIRSGNTTDENGHILELSLKLDSNPEFTGSVLTAYGRAVARLAKEGKTGVVTVFDIPIKYLSPISEEDLRKNLL